MPSTQEILDAAKKVGQMVASHDATQKLESSLKALEADPDAQRAITDFNRFLQALAQKEQAGKPIEVEDKRKLESLQQAVVMNIKLRNFQMAQMDYVDLLRKIDDAIVNESGDALAAIGGAPGSNEPAASPLINPDLAGGMGGMMR